MGAIVKPKGRKGGKAKPPPEIPKPGTPEDTRSDLAVAAAQALQSKGSLPPADCADEMAQLIASDPYLFMRPRLRWLIKLAGNEDVCMMDGSPLMVGKEGEEKKTVKVSWMKALARQEMLKAINGDPAAREFCLHTLFGAPPKSMEVSGPAGGPIETTSPPTALLSPEEMATRLVRSMRIAQAIFERSKTTPELEGVEVSASTNSEGVQLPPDVAVVPDSAVPPAAGAMPRPATVAIQAKPAPKPAQPAVGSISTRRG
jgi:hypothetical protein